MTVGGLTKALLTADRQRLLAQGIEPNPGPPKEAGGKQQQQKKDCHVELTQALLRADRKALLTADRQRLLAEGIEANPGPPKGAGGQQQQKKDWHTVQAKPNAKPNAKPVAKPQQSSGKEATSATSQLACINVLKYGYCKYYPNCKFAHLKNVSDEQKDSLIAKYKEAKARRKAKEDAARAREAAGSSAPSAQQQLPQVDMRILRRTAEAKRLKPRIRDAVLAEGLIESLALETQQEDLRVYQRCVDSAQTQLTQFETSPHASIPFQMNQLLRCHESAWEAILAQGAAMLRSTIDGWSQAVMRRSFEHFVETVPEDRSIRMKPQACVCGVCGAFVHPSEFSEHEAQHIRQIKIRCWPLQYRATQVGQEIDRERIVELEQKTRNEIREALRKSYQAALVLQKQWEQQGKKAEAREATQRARTAEAVSLGALPASAAPPPAVPRPQAPTAPAPAKVNKAVVTELELDRLREQLKQKDADIRQRDADMSAATAEVERLRNQVREGKQRRQTQDALAEQAKTARHLQAVQQAELEKQVAELQRERQETVAAYNAMTLQLREDARQQIADLRNSNLSAQEREQHSAAVCADLKKQIEHLTGTLQRKEEESARQRADADRRQQEEEVKADFARRQLANQTRLNAELQVALDNAIRQHQAEVLAIQQRGAASGAATQGQIAALKRDYDQHLATLHSQSRQEMAAAEKKMREERDAELERIHEEFTAAMTRGQDAVLQLTKELQAVRDQTASEIQAERSLRMQLQTECAAARSEAETALQQAASYLFQAQAKEQDTEQLSNYAERVIEHINTMEGMMRTVLNKKRQGWERMRFEVAQATAAATAAARAEANDRQAKAAIYGHLQVAVNYGKAEGLDGTRLMESITRAYDEATSNGDRVGLKRRRRELSPPGQDTMPPLEIEGRAPEAPLAITASPSSPQSYPPAAVPVENWYVFSEGRNGDDLTTDEDVEDDPGPSAVTNEQDFCPGSPDSVATLVFTCDRHFIERSPGGEAALLEGPPTAPHSVDATPLGSPRKLFGADEFVLDPATPRCTVFQQCGPAAMSPGPAGRSGLDPPHWSGGRGGDDLTSMGDIERNPGPVRRASARPVTHSRWICPLLARASGRPPAANEAEIIRELGVEDGEEIFEAAVWALQRLDVARLNASLPQQLQSLTWERGHVPAAEQDAYLSDKLEIPEIAAFVWRVTAAASAATAPAESGRSTRVRSSSQPARRPHPPPAECTCGRDPHTSGRHNRSCPVTLANAVRRPSQATSQPRPSTAGQIGESTVPRVDDANFTPAAVRPVIPWRSGGEVPPAPLPPFSTLAQWRSWFRPQRFHPTPEAVHTLSRALVSILQAVSGHCEDALRQLLMLVPALFGGLYGVKSRERQRVLNTRLRRWASGQCTELLEEALAYEQTRRKTAADAHQSAVDPQPPGAEASSGLPVPSEPASSLLEFYPPLADVSGLPPPRALKAAGVAARRCEYRRAGMLLRGGSIAPTTPENAEILRQKHPHGAALVWPSSTSNALPRPERLSVAEVRSALRSFPRGAAAGITGITPDLLKYLVDRVGDVVLEPLTRFLDRFIGAENGLPDSALPYLFGALLVALPKSDGGLRPIACGDIFRRLAGKALARRVLPRASRYLLSCRQVAVGVSGGADAMVGITRRYAARLEPGRVIVKVDFSNAFNELHRQAILDAMVALPDGMCADLAGYFTNAYAVPTLLTFGEHSVVSSQGVQQGDPLGPLFFAIALARCLVSVRARAAELCPTAAADLEAWYLDDGVLGGSVDAVAAFIAALGEIGPAVGLQLNTAKCEVFFADALDVAPFSAFGVRLPVAELTLLGVPCGGSAEALRRWAAPVLQAGAEKMRWLAAVAPHGGIHPAFALFRFCGHATLVDHLVRHTGYFADLEEYDSASLSSLESILGVRLGPLDKDQATLPLRHGGLGVRRTVVSASAAVAAAAIRGAMVAVPLAQSAAALADERLFAPAREHPAAALAQDPTFLESPARQAILEALAKPTPEEVAQGASPTEDGDTMPPRRGLQHAFSRVIDQARLEQLRAELVASAASPEPDVSERASLQFRRLGALASQQSTSGYLTMYPGGPLDDFFSSGRPGLREDVWLSDGQFRVLIDFRFARPLAAGPVVCSGCRQLVDDRYGEHSLSCMRGGGRSLLSSDLTRAIGAVASAAGFKSVEQPTPFVTDSGARPDLAVYAGDATYLVDNAVTHASLGAPTSYEARKYERYGQLAAVESALFGIPMPVVPFVFDTVGGLGEGGAEFLRILTSAFSTRFGIHRAVAAGQIRQRLNCCLMYGISNILRRNATLPLAAAPDAAASPASAAATQSQAALPTTAAAAIGPSQELGVPDPPTALRSAPLAPLYESLGEDHIRRCLSAWIRLHPDHPQLDRATEILRGPFPSAVWRGLGPMLAATSASSPAARRRITEGGANRARASSAPSRSSAVLPPAPRDAEAAADATAVPPSVTSLPDQPAAVVPSSSSSAPAASIVDLQRPVLIPFTTPRSEVSIVETAVVAHDPQGVDIGVVGDDAAQLPFQQTLTVGTPTAAAAETPLLPTQNLLLSPDGPTPRPPSASPFPVRDVIDVDMLPPDYYLFRQREPDSPSIDIGGSTSFWAPTTPSSSSLAAAAAAAHAPPPHDFGVYPSDAAVASTAAVLQPCTVEPPPPNTPSDDIGWSPPPGDEQSPPYSLPASSALRAETAAATPHADVVAASQPQSSSTFVLPATSLAADSSSAPLLPSTSATATASAAASGVARAPSRGRSKLVAALPPDDAPPPRRSRARPPAGNRG